MHVWEWFLDLSAARRGYDPLSYTEIGAFFAAIKVDPDPLEIEVLRVLDNEWILIKADSLKKDR